MRVYHGSDSIIKIPLYGRGKEDNDYGSGFYTTEDREKADAWAVVNGSNSAYCNIYDIDTQELDILRLDNFGVLAWISEVIAHRGIMDEDVFYTAQALVDRYKIDTDEYDIIIGYRADDSYTKVIDAFLKNQLTIDEVQRFFHKGNLGEQVFIKSQKAFDRLHFAGAEAVTEQEKYKDFDANARREVEKFLNSRRRAIQIEGYQPKGLTAYGVIKTNYTYNQQWDYYEQEPQKRKNARDYDEYER